MKNLFQRGWKIWKAGKAIREIRRSTDEESRERARHYLMELLGQSHGLSHKVGQFLSMEGGNDSLQNTLKQSTPSMSYEEFIEQIERAYDRPYSQLFKHIDSESHSASLGQVHFGTLTDGRRVAIKVQYPNIQKFVESELTLFGWMPKLGPVSKWGFDLEGYRETFHQNFTCELDYPREANQQEKYRTLCQPLEDVVVPEVYSELCRPNILVQALEEGLSLRDVEDCAESERKSFGVAVLRHYLFMIFREGRIHSDPHPSNFAFRKGNPDALVLYDFGSVLSISDDVRLGLIRTILALREREHLEPLACLVNLGFEEDKLLDLGPALPALLQVLFEPFLTDTPFDSRDWKMSERFDIIAGDLKWWFRSAAPPKLIFLMRTLHGLIHILNRLKVSLSWHWIFESLCSDLFPQPREFPMPEISSGKCSTPFSRLSRFLKVQVIKVNGNKIDLSMPARVTERLEQVIDAPVLETIRRQGIDLQAIQKRALQSGCTPQTLFEVKDSERQVKVWLE